MRRIIFGVGLLWAWGMASSQATDVFDPATNTLSIPSLQIGSRYYDNAQLLLSPGGQWSVLSLGASRATATDTATATGATSTVTTLSISPTAIDAEVGEEISVAAGGGTPPYSFVAARSILGQSFKSGNVAKFVAYGVGSSDVVVTDAAGNQVTAKVTVTSKLWVTPTTVGGVVGEQLTIYFGNGVPPYRVGTSNSTIAKAGEVTMHAPLQGSVTIYTYRAGTATIMVHDDYGNLVSTALTVTSNR